MLNNLTEQKSKRQFKTGRKKRTFYDRKVRKVGFTLSISLGKVIPKGWTYIRITPIKREGNVITITLEKLVGENNHAQTAKNNKGSQQDA